MQAQFLFVRHYILLALIIIGVVFSMGGCASSASPAAAASQPVVVAAAQPKINIKIAPADYQAKFGANVEHVLLDVRTPQEFASGHIPGAINISIDELTGRLSEVPQDKPVVLYCRSGNRSNQAAQILDRAGYTQIYDLGGIINWVQQGYPIQ
ncbi:MAG: rhodanese-like domain-containing protein [Caldilinea sp.]